MTWGQIFGTALVAGMWIAVVCALWLDGRDTREARRLGRIDTRPPVRTINAVRRDPSPQPRSKAS